MARVTPAYLAQMQALRSLYARDLPRKTRAIAKAASVGAKSGSPRSLESLYRLVHRLAGSAAIFGFVEVSRAASILEDLVARAIRDGAPCGSGRRSRLLALAAALEKANIEVSGTSLTRPSRVRDSLRTRADQGRTGATSRTRSKPRVPSGP